MADNSSRRFKFISPGVFIDEIDNSQLPRTPTAVGPLVMGRAQRGPANIPVTINSFSEFGVRAILVLLLMLLLLHKHG